jgi:hypothetical protein
MANNKTHHQFHEFCLYGRIKREMRATWNLTFVFYPLRLVGSASHLETENPLDRVGKTK